jgi:catechol 2,3-dioxygenase-like lactoylglutathione lyase family enzyme
VSGGPVKQLSHVCLSTRDLAATERFYVGLLGFKIVHEFRNAAGERYGFFVHAGGGTFLEFFNKPDAGRQEALFRHLCFEVDDIEAFAAHARANGFPDVAIKRGRTDHILQCFITDPDGTPVELQQHDEQSVLKPYLSGQ